MNIRCLNCGHEFSVGEALKAGYRPKNLFRLMTYRPRGIFCPKCDIEGTKHFVCAECGQYHMAMPGKCGRVA